MDVLANRMLLRVAYPARSRRFYGQTLGLAVFREYGDPDDPGTVYFLGNGLLEVTGGGDGRSNANVTLWLQVRDVRAEHDRLVDAGVAIDRSPAVQPWGLIEMWLSDPDGTPIVVVEVPADHPLRRDPR